MNLIDSDVGKIPHTDIQYIDTGVKPGWIEPANNEKYWLRVDEALYRDTVWYPPQVLSKKLRFAFYDGSIYDGSIMSVDIKDDRQSWADCVIVESVDEELDIEDASFDSIIMG